MDETVQRLVNRLIFIRTCEDRKLEEPVLLPLVRQSEGWGRLRSLWESLKQKLAEFDSAYDSELFAHHVLAGKNIDRYVAQDTGDLLHFPYQVVEGVATPISADTRKNECPATWQYLCDHETELRGRERGTMDHARWYAYVYPKNLALHDIRKLAVPRLVHRLEACHDVAGQYYLDNVDVGGIVLHDASHEHYLFVLGLLNGKLMDWYFQRVSAPFRGGFRSANRQFLEPLPIHRIESAADRELHDAIVAKVEEMLDLQAGLSPLRHSPSSLRADLLRKVERVDQQIDQLVFELYGLTTEEQRLVSE